MVELRHYRYFIAVAEELNVTHAARRLNIAQPPLSRSIHDLEALAGTRLFQPTARPMRLTDAGRFLLEEARRVIAASDWALDGARRIGQGHRGWIGVGFVASAMQPFLPRVLRAFGQAYPDIEIALREMNPGRQAEALRDRRIHLGLVRPRLPGDEFEQTVMFADELGIALAADHPLAANAALPLAALREVPIITYDAGMHPSFATHQLRLCDEAGFTPRVAMQVDQPSTALNAVAGGLGFSLIGRSMFAQERPGCRLVPINPPAPQHPLYAASRHGESAPVVGAFLGIARAEVAVGMGTVRQGETRPR